MKISFSAVHRMAAMAAAKDPELRRLARSGKVPTIARGKALSDAQLLAKLSSFGVKVDRAWLAEQCRKHTSAEEIARGLYARLPDSDQEGDWIWICLTVLWERWFPDLPSFEMLDDKMQRGYERLAANDEAGAAREWLEAWQDVLTFSERLDLRTVESFDERFGGTQSLFNWVQDVPDALWNAGRDDKALWRERIAFCQCFLDQFDTVCDLTIENMRRDVAETHAALGDIDKAEALFREWLRTDPEWGWGWIGWADCYSMGRLGGEDTETAKRILRQGLAVAGVRDRQDLLERLSYLREDSDGEPLAGDMEQSIEFSPSGNAGRLKTSVCFDEPSPTLEQLPQVLGKVRASHPPMPGPSDDDVPAPTIRHSRKVGRNAPCPCGSGKKYKKCCGST